MFRHRFIENPSIAVLVRMDFGKFGVSFGGNIEIYAFMEQSE